MGLLIGNVSSFGIVNACRAIFFSAANTTTQSYRLDRDYFFIGFLLPSSQLAQGNAWILSTDGTSTAAASVQGQVRSDNGILAYGNVLANPGIIMMGIRILLKKNTKLYFSNSYGVALYMTVYLEETDATA